MLHTYYLLRCHTLLENNDTTLHTMMADLEFDAI